MKSQYAQAAANIKKELSKAFPGIKFTVRSKSFSMGNSVDVDWTLGPTTKEVDAIIGKYQQGNFNGMIDCYEYDHNQDAEAFRAANGSSKYVMSQRNIPFETIVQICRDIATLQGDEFTTTRQRRTGETLDLEDYAHRALARCAFPAGAEYVGVEYGEEISLNGACSVDELFKIIHTQTDREADLRTAIRAEFDEINARQEWKTKNLACGVTTIGPDDLIIPCVLSTGHQGYCSTGR